MHRVITRFFFAYMIRKIQHIFLREACLFEFTCKGTYHKTTCDLKLLEIPFPPATPPQTPLNTPPSPNWLCDL